MAGLEQMFRPGMADVRRKMTDPANKMDAEHLDTTSVPDVISGLRALDNGYRAGPRESSNVRDYRKEPQPFLDELVENVVNLPRNTRTLAQQEGWISRRDGPSPEKISGALPTHWPRR